MMNIIVAAESLGERALTALKDSALGMVVVFAALCIIWVAIEILHLCVAAGTKRKTKEPEIIADQPAADASEEGVSNGDDEAAVVAAITAALSVMLEEPVGSFKVVSFKRVDAHAHWNRK